ncbi:MAG: hypothetical protein BGP22_34205 [Variovorax sp. 67-131]|nr:MAG: hypothetical protein ABS94_05395 [Variovorax sp. SCN 67-85]ODV26894.1 MAG: hypothetical protein ABT25_04320 [Variovorax sp. SCN 67-20]OJZ08990.1 MAG: hypothetical protein BGP22_34205 [Variovorax sp. 67-131]
MAANLLAQLVQLGGRQAPAGHGLLAADLFALRRPVGGDGIADLAAAHLADPQEVVGNRLRPQRRAGTDDEK